METKYYTPTLEEFCLGFEYEMEDDDCGKKYWQSTIFNELGILKLTQFYPMSFKTLQERINNEEIRVKYLDQSDLEELGWILINEFKTICSYTWSTFTKQNIKHHELNSIKINYSLKCSFEEDIKIIITKNIDNSSFDIFNGEIKNKSELIKLFKQLEIK